MKNNLRLYTSLFSNHFFLCLISFPLSSFSQGAWTQKADLPVTIPTEGAVGFSIGTKGYVCTSNLGNMMWEWNSQNNTWTQKANFSGVNRKWAAAFSIDGKGYVGTGWKSTSPNQLNDFWEYDTTNNAWVQKANFPGLGRGYAVGFAVDSFGFIGSGISTSGAMKDFWKYIPASDIWVQCSDFPGCARSNAIGISLGRKGYFGFGQDTCGGINLNNDWWSYDPYADNWTKLLDLPSNTRELATGFGIADKLYAGTGWIGISPFEADDFWSYDTVTNSWSQVANFSAGGRDASVGFSIGGKGYITTGKNQSGGFWDLWEFDPYPISVQELQVPVNVSLFPNPISYSASIKINSLSGRNDRINEITIYNSKGGNATNGFLIDINQIENTIIIKIHNANMGIYFYRIKAGANELSGKFIVK